MWKRVARGFEAIDALLSVVVACAVGVLTNLATEDDPSAGVISGLAGFVAVQALSVALRLRKLRSAARVVRDRVLAPVLGSTPPGSAVEWLSPVHTPTRLWARSTELRTLLDWCLDGDADDVVRVLAGPAGGGKSRLVVELARSLGKEKKTWFIGQATGSEGVFDAVSACGDPCLIVVEDADLVPDVGLLIRHAAATSRESPIRLLLLVRSPDALLHAAALPAAQRPLLTSKAPVVLMPVGGEDDRTRWFEQAVRGYATALRTPAPDEVRAPAGDEEDVIAVLHIRALEAILRRADDELSFAGLMDALWEEESHRWGRDSREMAEIVTALTLHPASTTDEAVAVLRRLPRFTTTSSEVLTALAESVRTRLPHTPDGRAGLRPHLLAEHVVLRTAARLPGLLAFDGGAHLATTTAILTRAVMTYPAEVPVLIDALRRNEEHREVMVRTVLVHATPSRALDQALAELFVSGLAVPSGYPLTRCAAEQRRVDQLRGDENASSPALALALAELASALSELGRYDDAVVHAKEAVAISQTLGSHEQTLAMTVLGSQLASLGRNEDALAVAEQMLAMHRTTQGAFKAVMVANVGVQLSRMGREVEALALIDEAVRTLRETGSSEVDLADCTIQLSSLLVNAGRHDEARTAAEDALALCRVLVREDPWEHRARLAHSLLTSSKVLSYFGQYAQAVDLVDEATALLREAAALNPRRYRPDLIACLIERASRLAQAGRYREALPVARQAEKTLRHQANGGSESDRCLLAIHLSNTGSLLAREHRCSEALAVTQEAVTLLESCSNTGPYHRALGDALLNLGVRFAEADREREGLTAAERSVAVIRVFVEEDPRGNAATYSRALENLARRRHALGDAEGALEAITEAVDAVEPWAGLGAGTVLTEQYRDAKILLRCWDPAIGR